MTSDRRPATFADRLVHAWYEPRPTILTRALAPLSAIFGAVSAMRRSAYRHGLFRATRIPVPVVVVGNIAVGGTGKTPLVIALVAALRMHGRRPGIVSRGYGGSAARAGPRPVDADSDPDLVGDEPALLARCGAPVWVGTGRVETALALLATHPEVDVIVCDDGLQHYALERDCEIVVVDAARGFGNGWLLPAGPLREPLARLDGVDAIVVNGEPSMAATTTAGLRARSSAGASAGSNLSATAAMGAAIEPAGAPVYAMQLVGDRFVNLATGALATPAEIGSTRVHAVAGIGNPERFFATLASLGVDAIPHPFPDHHRYVEADLAFADASAIVMTEKDAIKCSRFASARMWSLPVTARLDPALVERVIERIGATGRSDASEAEQKHRPRPHV